MTTEWETSLDEQLFECPLGESSLAWQPLATKNGAVARSSDISLMAKIVLVSADALYA